MSVWLWVGYWGGDEEYILFLNLRLRIKPGENKNVRGKACFAGEGEGGLHKGGRNFLVSIFNVAINLFWGEQYTYDDYDEDDFVVPGLCLATQGGHRGTVLCVALRFSQEPFDVHPLWILLCRDLG